MRASAPRSLAAWLGVGLVVASALGCGSAEEDEAAGDLTPEAGTPAEPSGGTSVERLGASANEARERAAAKANEAWAAIQELYEQAKDAGETVPDDVVEWTKADIGRIGDWEYRIESLPADREQMQTQLNEWGQDRWEAYWVELDASGYTVHLKRPARSYLRMIPVGDVLKVLPSGGSGNGD